MSRKSAARAAAQAAEIKRSPLVFLGSDTSRVLATVSHRRELFPAPEIARKFSLARDHLGLRSVCPKRVRGGAPHPARNRDPAPRRRRAQQQRDRDPARPKPALDRKPPHPSFPKAQTPFRGGVGSLRRARGADRRSESGLEATASSVPRGWGYLKRLLDREGSSRPYPAY